MTKTRRLPRTLRKKFEASLTKLTPREAGRLFLLYLHEVGKDGSLVGFGEHPPVKELEAAWDKRLEDARRKGPEVINQEAALLTGFNFLEGVAIFANDFADREAFRLASTALATYHVISNTLEKDSVSAVARRASNLLHEQLPHPADWNEIKKLKDYAENDDLEDLRDVAVEMAEVWVEAQGFTKGIFEQDEELAQLATIIEENREDVRAIIEKHRDPALIETDEMTEEELRRFYAEWKGNALLTGFFKGDREALNFWVKYGSWAGPGMTEAVWDAKRDEAFDRLVAMVKAGELEGGEAVSLEESWGDVLIIEGKLPAWAALRSIFCGWAYAYDLLRREEPVEYPDALNGVWSYYSIDGDLQGDALVNVVAEFVADCRAQPWGAGLARDIDFAALGQLLVEFENPLVPDHGEALGLGLVDLEAFKTAEGEDPFFREGESFWVATTKSLKAKAVDLGLRPEAIGHGGDWILENYYFSRNAKQDRENRGQIMRLLNSLRVPHKPLACNDEDRRDPFDVFGVEFMTQLQEAIKTLGGIFGDVETLKLIFDRLSGEYFGGLPVLVASRSERVSTIEALLKITEEELTEWVAKLQAPPWEMDTTGLELVKQTADEAEAREAIDFIVLQARKVDASGYFEIDLGPEEEPVAKKATPGASRQSLFAA